MSMFLRELEKCTTCLRRSLLAPPPPLEATLQLVVARKRKSFGGGSIAQFEDFNFAKKQVSTFWPRKATAARNPAYPSLSASFRASQPLNVSI
ncbi:hypothetical protein GOP47_0020860 [Adiantum capillus-veneris]|uniref:Uncharacterized protein n=1 Tax=Adiantum capillus-veneris TaxID=13818 RepID=A0A9D4UA74_ADICA|nr:hypothetical protein GOP47_0020860 [Adiantum capillus-veneris]